MMKTLLIFLFGLICFQTVKAQKPDTVLLYMTNSNKVVETKDSADYFLQIMMPPDSSTGIKINQIKEFFRDRRPKLIGTAIIYLNYRWVNLQLVGTCVSFYENGHRQSIMNYKNGLPSGIQTLYFPNGKLYATERYNEKSQCLLIDSHDSTGKVLATDGDGYWIKYSKDFKKE